MPESPGMVRVRRRSASSDPLKKITFQLSESVIEAMRAAVKAGETASANAFVEEAVREKLRERRRAAVYAAYEQASQDPEYMRELDAELKAFDPTLSD